MTAVFPLTWPSFCLGLHAWPFGQAGLATLRQTFSPSNLSKQRVHGIHGCLKRSKALPSPTWNSRPTVAPYASVPPLSGQARCASLRKSKGTKAPRQKAARNETPMSRAEINAVFGVNVGLNDGNDLLERLQEQRLQGTLDQKLPYPDALIDKGLHYLRAKHPLDEDAAIIARIDSEADAEFRLAQTNIDRSPHAVSQFDKFIRENRQRREKEEAEEKEKERQVTEIRNVGQEESASEKRRITVRDGTSLVQLRPEPEWVAKYRDKAQMKEIPETSLLAKLLPSALLTVAVITVAVLFAQNYKQPSRKARLWPDLPPAAATIIALISVNVGVFVLWRVPQLWRFLNRNFVIVPAYPYSLSMLMACFSHQDFTHLLPNMIVLWLIGTRLHDDVGRGPFLALYFSSAVIAAYLPMVVFISKGSLGIATLGASGAIAALIGTSCVLHEGLHITLPFLPPEWTRGVDTGVLLAILIIIEAMRLRKWGLTPAKSLHTRQPAIDTMGHLCGYAVGICAGALIRSTDPRWKNAKRKHFFTKDFGKS